MVLTWHLHTGHHSDPMRSLADERTQVPEGHEASVLHLAMHSDSCAVDVRDRGWDPELFTFEIRSVAHAVLELIKDGRRADPQVVMKLLADWGVDDVVGKVSRVFNMSPVPSPGFLNEYASTIEDFHHQYAVSRRLRGRGRRTSATITRPPFGVVGHCGDARCASHDPVGTSRGAAVVGRVVPRLDQRGADADASP